MTSLNTLPRITAVAARHPMIIAFCGATIVATGSLMLFGTETTGIVHSLQTTARFSFLLFWSAYIGRALRTLFKINLLAMYGREFGLAFAAAHLVHIGLVCWLYRISETPPVSTASLVFFSIAVFWTYVLAICSLRGVTPYLPPTIWRLIRFVGSEYIAFAFLIDFIQLSSRHLLAYLPFAAMSIMATFLRVVAWWSRYHQLDAPRQRSQ